MRKLYEIGDQPLPMNPEKVEEDRIIYTFSITPAKGPYQDMQMDYYVIFEKEEDTPAGGLLWEFNGYTIDEFPKEQIAIIRKAEQEGKTLNMWNVLFSAKIDAAMEDEWEDPIHFELLDLEDAELTIKIMRTIENAVTTFFEKHSTEIDAVTFAAATMDHGRISVYTRYAKMLEKQLGWKTLAGYDDFEGTKIFICYDENLLKEP